jgi:hypothetical protein
MSVINSLLESVRARSQSANDKLVDIERAIERTPDNPIPIYKLARFCRRMGLLDLWNDVVSVALALPHVTSEQVYERSSAKLLRGDWSGWIDREARFDNPRSKYFQLAHVKQFRWGSVEWDGKEELADLSLLVLADGGFGDCIQMLRFIPQLATMAKQVALGVRPELVAFVRYNFDASVSVVLRDSPISVPFQRYMWGMSLPARSGSLPAFRALRAPEAADGIRGDTRKRVGLCWAGNPDHPRDAKRSIPIAALEPLLVQRGIQLHSLQVGYRAGDCAIYPWVVQPPRSYVTFAETASVVAALDFVVTVDTSVAHLAGSLGIPTLILLDIESEFRWGQAAATPWYPSVRLLRQRAPGDWSTVVEEVRLALDIAAHHHCT